MTYMKLKCPYTAGDELNGQQCNNSVNVTLQQKLLGS